jgi:predicted outer membrane protein
MQARLTARLPPVQTATSAARCRRARRRNRRVTRQEVGGAARTAFVNAPRSRSPKRDVQGNIAEVRLGEFASQRAENAAVREFGETLRQDHTAGSKRSAAVAKSMKVDAPTEPMPEAKRHYDGLAQLSGSQFDAAFVSHMIVAHEAEIAKYSLHTSSDYVACSFCDRVQRLRARATATRRTAG